MTDSLQPLDDSNTYAGARVKERRLALGMSQTALGEAAGISFQQIQKYERGVNRISIAMLNKFAAALRVPLSYFLPDESSAARALASNAAAPYDAGTPKDTRELLALFDSIEDPKLRKQVLELTKALSKTKGKAEK